jgi:hypothetical protein
MTVFDRAWESVRKFDGSFKPFPPEAEADMDEQDRMANQRHRDEYGVDVDTTEGDECCEKVRAEFKDYLIWATHHGDKNAEVIGWLIDEADCDRFYALLENMAPAHPRARQFLQMWDDCSSGKNAEGME